MADLLRVSLVGTMPNGEEWSVNPVFSVGGDFGVPVSPTQAQTIATAIANISVPAGLTAVNASSVSFTGCRVEARLVDGTLESIAEAIDSTPSVGSGPNVHPFQTSIVSSLRTGTPGASGRGRLYWPATALTLTVATLRPTSSLVLTTLTAVQQYLVGIEGAIEVTLTGTSLCVWSRKNAALYPVTSLQMGDVADVQRRRRDVLVESYQTLAYSA